MLLSSHLAYQNPKSSKTTRHHCIVCEMNFKTSQSSYKNSFKIMQIRDVSLRLNDDDMPKELLVEIILQEMMKILNLCKTKKSNYI